MRQRYGTLRPRRDRVRGQGSDHVNSGLPTPRVILQPAPLIRLQVGIEVTAFSPSYGSNEAAFRPWRVLESRVPKGRPLSRRDYSGTYRPVSLLDDDTATLLVETDRVGSPERRNQRWVRQYLDVDLHRGSSGGAPSYQNAGWYL